MHIAAGKGFLETMKILSAGGDHTAAVSVNLVSKASKDYTQYSRIHVSAERLGLWDFCYICVR